MGFEIRDRISPELERLTRSLGGPGKRQVLEAMGQQLVTLTKLAFNDPSLRPTPWAPKRDGSAATLKRSGTLQKSIRIAGLTDREVTVASDRVYAAIHQLGGTIVPKTARALVFRVGDRMIFAKKVTIPPRPFFPFSAEGEMTPLARSRIESIARAKIRSILRQ